MIQDTSNRKHIARPHHGKSSEY